MDTWLPVVQSARLHSFTITNKHPTTTLPPILIWSRKGIIEEDGVYCLVKKKKNSAKTALIFWYIPESCRQTPCLGDVAGSLYATFSQHFLPPHSCWFLPHNLHSLLLLRSTVAEMVSHFKGCESGFQKLLPPFNLSNAPWVSNQTISHSFTGSCGWDVSVVKLLQVSLDPCRADQLTWRRNLWKERPTAGFKKCVRILCSAQIIMHIACFRFTFKTKTNKKNFTGCYLNIHKILKKNDNDGQYLQVLSCQDFT